MTTPQPEWMIEFEKLIDLNYWEKEDEENLRKFIKKVEADAYERGQKESYRQGFIDGVHKYQEKEATQHLKDAAIVKSAMSKLHGGGNARRILQGVYDQIINQ